MSTILEAATQMRLSAQAVARLRPAMDAHTAVQTVLEDGLTADALSLLARLLPRRYAVAWVCQCGSQQTLGEHDRAGLALAQAWVLDPGEAHRESAASFADAHRYRTIGAWAAAAAGWTGGNLNPRYERPTPPPEHLTAIAAMAALTYMAALLPAQLDTRCTAFIRDAMGLLGTRISIDGARQ
ncbi:DUF6931 family protein [Paraburkholderia caffeinilytica]|uniref:DUF6931 family protein n=1 Tax=Paraburkholderia caffeinilytica TaxID=1761016 RepID=UPI0038B9594B